MLSVKVTGAKELSKKFNRLQKKLPRQTKKAIRKSLIYGRKIAKQMAPVKTGALKAGIRFRVFPQKGYGILMSTVQKDYPYHFWINEVPGYKYATLARRRTPSGSWPTRAIRARWPRIYTKRWLYRATKHTGVPSYFTKTIEMMEKKYPATMRRAVKTAINQSGFRR